MTNPVKPLPFFRWQGRNKQRLLIKGKAQAKTALALRANLRRQGITQVRIQRILQPQWPWQRIMPADITHILRQMAVTIAAGIPLVQSLEMLIHSTEKPKLNTLLQQLKSSIESGKSLATSLRTHSALFPESLTQLIHAGEQSGTLAIMLTRIADHREKTAALRKQIQRALFYPGMVMVIAIIIAVILLLFVVPTFQGLFASFGAQLPAFTQTIINLSQTLQHQGVIMGFGLILLVLLMVTAYRRLERLKKYSDQWLLKLPIIGSLLQQGIIVQCANTLAITLAAGMPLIQALELIAKTNRNRVYQQALLSVQQQVSQGLSLHQAVSNTGRFPALLAQMIRIGEASGALDTMLVKVAQIYQEQVDHRVAKLTTLLEPLIMSVLGVMVGGLVLAMYLPIFKMGSVI